MAKLLYPLGLVIILFSLLLRTVLGVTLDQLFVVHSGGSNGGCDSYFNQASKTGTLDDWLDEINISLSTAVDSLDSYNQDIRVRRALWIFFGIRNVGRASKNAQVDIDKIGATLKSVQEFFSLQLFTTGEKAGQPIYPLNNNRFLFCGSDFLVSQTMNSAALDWKANIIKDDKGNPVTIAGVSGYFAANAAAEVGSTPWWSGTHSPVNGYYFSPTGGVYCTTSTNPNDPNDFPLGLTALIEELKVDSSGNPTQRTPINSIIICGVAFTNTNQPASYKVGNAAISAGTNLQKVVPKSATLLHEAFHLIFGVDNGEDPNNPIGFLEGDELYDIAQCIDAAKVNPVKTARRNPENYVFFVAHMYYLFGAPDGNAGTSIDKNWDFEMMVQSGKQVLGAKNP